MPRLISKQFPNIMRLFSCIYVKIFYTRGFFLYVGNYSHSWQPITAMLLIRSVAAGQQSKIRFIASFTILSFRCAKYISLFRIYPANIYLFKVTNRSIRKRCEICSKLIIKTPMLIVKMEQLLQPLYCHYIFVITILYYLSFLLYFQFDNLFHYRK